MVDLLVGLVDRFGLWKVLTAPVVVLSVLVGVAGRPLGWSPSLVIGSSLLAFMGVVCSAIFLKGLRDRERAAKGLESALAALRRYIYGLNLKSTTELWRDEISVRKNGDAVWSSILRIRANDPVHFVEFAQGGEPLSKRRQRRMSFDVRDVATGGHLPLQVDWISSSEVRVWVYLPAAIPSGGTITIGVRFTWPEQLPELGKGRREEFRWAMARPTDRLEYLVILDAKHKRNRDLGYNKEGPVTDPVQKGEAGTWRVEGYAQNLASDQEIALWLDAGT